MSNARQCAQQPFGVKCHVFAIHYKSLIHVRITKNGIVDYIDYILMREIISMPHKQYYRI